MKRLENGAEGTAAAIYSGARRWRTTPKQVSGVIA
jgi:hypothetical protein